MTTRPPRPSPQHWYDRETNTWVHPYDLSVQREEMLTDDDFEDIERVGHSDLRGPRASVSLKTVLSELGIRTSQAADEVFDAAHPLANYQDSFRARYYHHAQLLVSELVREGADPGFLFVARLHAEGHGAPYIMEAANADEGLLGREMTHWRIRKWLAPFCQRVLNRVENEGLDVSSTSWEDIL